MKKVKFYVGMVLAMVMCLSFTIVAYAKTTKQTDYYGTLSGSISAVMEGSSFKVKTISSVDSNKDKAILKVNIELQDRDGYTLDKKEDQSSKGATYFPKDFAVPHFDDVAIVYGAHGIQGGTKYGADAVYTSTIDIPR